MFAHSSVRFYGFFYGFFVVSRLSAGHTLGIFIRIERVNEQAKSPE
ncbi:MAG: hypothetical protein OJF49_002419 [Ktedonobacterales bacterium]|jgi:hypothetical protein|nr:MAG: hypothetical protein OJF49_002419 [Ktedonobacterales bacterium]